MTRMSKYWLYGLFLVLALVAVLFIVEYTSDGGGDAAASITGDAPTGNTWHITTDTVANNEALEIDNITMDLGVTLKLKNCTLEPDVKPYCLVQGEPYSNLYLYDTNITVVWFVFMDAIPNEDGFYEYTRNRPLPLTVNDIRWNTVNLYTNNAYIENCTFGYNKPITEESTTHDFKTSFLRHEYINCTFVNSYLIDVYMDVGTMKSDTIGGTIIFRNSTWENPRYYCARAVEFNAYDSFFFGSDEYKVEEGSTTTAFRPTALGMMSTVTGEVERCVFDKLTSVGLLRWISPRAYINDTIFRDVSYVALDTCDNVSIELAFEVRVDSFSNGEIYGGIDCIIEDACVNSYVEGAIDIVKGEDHYDSPGDFLLANSTLKQIRYAVPDKSYDNYVKNITITGSDVTFVYLENITLTMEDCDCNQIYLSNVTADIYSVDFKILETFESNVTVYYEIEAVIHSIESTVTKIYNGTGGLVHTSGDKTVTKMLQVLYINVTDVVVDTYEYSVEVSTLSEEQTKDIELVKDTTLHFYIGPLVLEVNTRANQSEGWVMVGLPIDESISASTLLFKSVFIEAMSVEIAGEYVMVIKDDTSPNGMVGDDFLIEPFSAVYLYVIDDIVITFDNTVSEYTDESIEVHVGYNLVSLPESVTASFLCAYNPHITEVTYRDSATGEYHTYNPFTSTADDDFTIQALAGVIMRSTKDAYIRL